MVNDFDAFAREFRQRAAARLVEFEKVLEQTHKDLEANSRKATQQVAHEAARGATQPAQSSAWQGSQQGVPQSVPQRFTQTMDFRQPVPPQRRPAPATPHGKAPAPPKRIPGQVQSVLRKG